jgi:xylulose-5-phosphate/fructose-6-phosphate phosphoketolase
MQCLSHELLKGINACWRAANDISAGQIHLYDNPLLLRALRRSDAKPLVAGQWGTTPGQNFLHAHLKRNQRDLNSIERPGKDRPEIRDWKRATVTKPKAFAAAAETEMLP